MVEISIVKKKLFNLLCFYLQLTGCIFNLTLKKCGEKFNSYICCYKYVKIKN